jgi:hypothetical protein
MDELVPLHHGDKGDDVDIGEEAIGSRSGSVFPPILAVIHFVYSMFLHCPISK